jgi:predicted N-acetyltransferase YhbS
MPDMLVKLYNLEHNWDFVATQEALGITIRKPIGPENQIVIEWVRDTFNAGWASEVAVALHTHPVSCFIALKEGGIIGFACYDATALGFFGPTGVAENERGKGTGAALLMACLLDMKLKGYGYAVIGGAGPVDFYRKVAGAEVIVDSVPGIYRGMLRQQGR